MPIRKKVKRIFVTVTDLASLVMSVIYVVYVTLMLTLPLGGSTWLNYGMLAVTIIYIIFFIIKIFYLNKLNPSQKIKKATKMTVRYTKYGMRLINAIFVVMSLITIRIGVEHLIPVVGVIIFVMTFVISVIWDVGLFFAKRRIRSMLTEWNSLDNKNKKDKIDFFIRRFLETLDNMSLSGYEEYVEYGAEATRIISEKIKQAQLGETDNPDLVTDKEE